MKYTKLGVKGLSMIRQVSFIITVLSVCSFAALDTTGNRLDNLESKIDDIMSIAGIQFGGEFRSQFLYSGLDNEKPGVSAEARTSENVEFTSVDFDIFAKPNDAISGRVIFRMHQDWRNFFSDIKNPIFTRWVGIEGNYNNMFLYNVGDFKQKYSPLTLYTPEVTPEFEPEIFAKRREYAMGEMFLGDNQRVLQGVNLTFAAQIDPLFKKFYAQAIGARLRLSGTAPKNGSAVAASFEEAEMDRYAVGFNTDMEIIESAKLGGTFLSIFDAPNTSDENKMEAEIMAEARFVGALRGGLGTAAFLESDIFDISLNGEIAFSNDRDSGKIEVGENTVIEEITNDDGEVSYDTVTTYDSTTSFSWVNGSAVHLDLIGDIKLGSDNKLNVNAGLIMNQKDFRNELAQSPSFIGQRIMNIENDDDVRLYSTFDAMYRSVFKFTPSQRTNNYDKAPFQKNSYTSSVLSEKDLAVANEELEQIYDPALQLVMPNGLATANRAGFKGGVGASLLNEGIKAKISAAMYNEMTGEEFLRFKGEGEEIDTSIVYAPKTSFSEFGIGASVDFSSFIDALSNTLKVSGGIKISNSKNDGLEDEIIEGEKTYYKEPMEISNSFMNAGLYWNFHKRFSFLAGYQGINTKNVEDSYEWTTKQQQWATGLEYKIGKFAGVVTGTIGQVMVSFEDNEDVAEGDQDISENDFAQWQTEVFLTVPF